MKRYVFRFLRKEARLSQDFFVVGSSFQKMGAATEKARLPRFSLVLEIESCCEVDDLSLLYCIVYCILCTGIVTESLLHEEGGCFTGDWH